MTRTLDQRQISRRGISRTSVLVMLGIFCLVGTLVTAGILQARENSRRLQCLCRSKLIGLAIHNFASGSQTFPPLTGPLLIKTDSSPEVEGQLMAPWLIQILPALDETELLRKIRSNAVLESDREEQRRYRIADSEKVTLGFLMCPEAASRASGLSYVVNTGFISRELYQGDPERKHLPGSLTWIAAEDDDLRANVHRATGVFWHDRSASLDDISTGDGATTTLMLTENLQAGHWFDLDTTQIAFAFPVANTKGQVPLGANAIFESVGTPLRTQSTALSSYAPRDWRINDDRTAAGTLPRPSSNHARPGVNAIMCDGSGRQISQKSIPKSI